MAITPEQLKSQYSLVGNNGYSHPGQKLSLDDIRQQYDLPSSPQGSQEETREERIAQGLPASTKARYEMTGKAKPSAGGVIARGLLSVPAKLAATASTGFRDKIEEGSEVTKPMKSAYLGDVTSLMTPVERGVDRGVAKVKEGLASGESYGKALTRGVGPTLGGAALSTGAAAGTGLEAGSYAIGAGPVVSVAKTGLKEGVKGLTKQSISALTKPTIKNLVKQTAKVEAKASAVGAFGTSVEQNIQDQVPFGKAVGNVAMSTGIGTGVGAVAGPTAAVGGRALGTTGRLLTSSGRAKISSDAVDKSVTSLKDLFGTQGGQRYVDNVVIRKGDEPFQLIVESGALKKTDISNNRPVTDRGLAVLRDGQQTFNKLLDESLDPAVEPRLVHIDEAAKRAMKNIQESRYTSKTKKNLMKQVADDFNAIMEEYGTDTFNLQSFNKIKQSFWGEAFPEGKAITDIDKIARNRKYLVGRGIMETIEDFAQNPDIRELNRVIGTYAEARKIMTKLGTQTLKKGKLGRYVLQGIGTGVGTAAAGPLGGIAGALGGDIVTNILQKLAVNSPIRSGMIRYVQKYRPDLTDRLNKYLAKRASDVANAPQLPAKSAAVADDTIRLGPFKKPDMQVPKKQALLPTQSVDNALLQEAKKYKIAEEFIDSQGKSMYRGGSPVSNESVSNVGVSISKSKKVAQDFAKQKKGTVQRIFVSPDAKLVDYSNIPGVKYKDIHDYSPELDVGDNQIWRDLEVEYQKAVNWASENGFDGINLPLEGEMRIINSDMIKTRSQLTDIWKQAHDL